MKTASRLLLILFVMLSLLSATSCSHLLNRPPQAVLVASSTVGVAPHEVTFDASSSRDPEGAVAVYEWAFGDGATGSGMQTTHLYPEAGTYVVRLTVRDENGRKDIAEQSILVRASTNYAIILGLSAYYYAPCLYFVDDDALAIRQALISSPGWDAENIVFLLNSDATSWNFASALDDLDSANENDLLFLFFSGHGGHVPDDAVGEEADGFDEVLYLYDSSWISDDVLERYLAQVPMRRIVVMVDSCFSGGQLGDGVALPAAADWAAEWLTDLSRIGRRGPKDLDALTKSIVAVMSSRETEYSWESSELEHGVFSKALLEALDGAGDEMGDRDGFVSAEECYVYAEVRVRELMASIGEEQHPQLLDLHAGELEFYKLP